MERQTKTLKTKTNGIEVVFKSYITYRETQDIMKNKELTQEQQAQEIMKVALISVNGVKENAFDVLYDIPLPDYIELQQELKGLIQGNFQTAK